MDSKPLLAIVKTIGFKIFDTRNEEMFAEIPVPGIMNK